MSAPSRWIVSQIGARQHYGVPRGFHYQGNLRAFYTDTWCRWGSAVLARGPARARAFAGRFSADLPSDRVSAFTWRTAWDRLRRGLARRQGEERRTTAAVYEEFLRFGGSFSRWVARDLASQTFDPARDVFFGFNTGCLETLGLLRERGVLTIVDQIDPARTEEELVFQEALRWPGWQESPGRIPDAYFDRLAAEWAAATLVVVNSEWSKRALVAQGVPAPKLLVVPVAYEPSGEKPGPRPVKTGPLTVLWIGTVNLRKGIPYLLGAARLLQRTDIRFVVAGPVEISRAAVASAPPNVSFLGRVTRDATGRHYREADIFALPTVSDGFAITQVEAMAQGLPVITTRRCGEVVTEGIDGLLVPVGDTRALAEAIARLDADRDLLSEMSRQAVLKAHTFHLPSQAAQIERAVRRFRREGPLDLYPAPPPAPSAAARVPAAEPAPGVPA